ncbi:hypothetical protein CH63R_08621 [Colletotrichum higginsianum IMI 349063]|uniref:Uncharacterized protein n=2 Tax=Colletotrichum higginsianum TaxID=80884 RepID=A0A1B7Y505_COLHI|nr:hypothetical protein CH63R_08621 [Colletotrichum higginsianum IMI 349063]OBR07100.1 hypothetical protein CH63R_08621 [Colletotrichum higginsianum IMI 349063]TIC92925.1 hypothetical protein CH35J_010103 [Colletotrichum higginsianum]
MKLQYITLLLGAVVHVQACIRIHARHFQAPWPEKDSLSIEIWDDDRTYYICPACSWESFSDQGCTVQCHQFKIEMGEYGKSGRVTNTNNGYSAKLSIKTLAKPENWCCLFGQNGNCRGQCTVWDTCLTDNFSNCDQYACRLCGGKQICGIRDKRDLVDGFEYDDFLNGTANQLDVNGVFGNKE